MSETGDHSSVNRGRESGEAENLGPEAGGDAIFALGVAQLLQDVRIHDAHSIWIE